MKIDFTSPILDLEGKPMKQGEKDVTLEEIGVTALLANHPDEKLEGSAKIERFGLALRIKAAVKDKVVMDLSAEEIVMLKSLISKAYSILVTGRAWNLLEGKG